MIAGLFGKNTKETSEMPDMAARLGRNDPCWCGSGKKYKKCHLSEDETKRSSKIASTCSIGKG